MRIDIPAPSTPGRGPRRGLGRRRPLSHSSVAALTAAATIVLTGSVFLVTVGAPDLRAFLRERAVERGHGLFGDSSIRDALAAAPLRLLRSVDVPHLVLDIKFEHMQTLEAKRAEAIASRLLIAEDEDFVPASIRFEGRTIPVDLRLKGDFTDHLQGDKWSFRIHVENDDHVLGMRRFSLQHPVVRNFHGEVLFFGHLRSAGLLAPRYSFVRVTVNGDDIGIMALEEHFSSELLEASGRREGVIVRYDESLFWDDRLLVRQTGRAEEPFNSYSNATVDAFRSNRVRGSPQLYRDYQTAIGLLRGFAAGELAASEAFDAVATGRFLAAAELWGASHALYWNNQRFYLNPVTLKLEPIAFDANISGNPEAEAIVTTIEPMVRRMLQDTAIAAAYGDAIETFSSDVTSGRLERQLSALQESQLSILHKEFFFLAPYPFEKLVRRAEHLTAPPPLESSNEVQDIPRYATPLRAYVLSGADGDYLELETAVPHPVVVTGGRWISSDSVPQVEALVSRELPRALPAREGELQQGATRMTFEAPGFSPAHLEITSHILGDARDYRTAAVSYAPPADRPPLPDVSVADIEGRHAFLVVDTVQRTIRGRAGTFDVHEDILVPRGFRLRLEPGTTLRFDVGVGLISRGALVFQGTAEAPIRLEGLSVGATGWSGVAVLQAPETSLWSHVTVSDTHGFGSRGWGLTGSVTFFESDIEATSSTFVGNRSEDALNVIGSSFDFTDLAIVDAAFDGLDVDFGQGRLSGGAFERIGWVGGGDAVDFSGSRATVEDSRFQEVGDKGVSVGERSHITLRRVTVSDAMAGAVVKDGSVLEVAASTFRDIRLASLMAYTKKPEYGAAALIASDLDFDGSSTHARAQTGNRIVLDGVSLPTELIDVDMLYETLMARGSAN